MKLTKSSDGDSLSKSFNPLDRGNLNQIVKHFRTEYFGRDLFQSPRSGKFESNFEYESNDEINDVFQSPRSGKFESNSLKNTLRLTMSF